MAIKLKFPKIRTLNSDSLCFRPEAADIDQWEEGISQVFSLATVE